MKLGICYMLFDAEEFLEYLTKPIRNQVDHISVTYQDVSYFGNHNDRNLKPLLTDLKTKGLIDQFIKYEPNLSLKPKQNELILRNLGLELSRQAGCTHHISSDIDEFYEGHQLEYAKKAMEKGYDYSMAPYAVYYKKPTYLVTPSQELCVTFIHPIDNEYFVSAEFPHGIETTRRLKYYNNCKLFTKEEILIHHMSFVRKDIHKKFNNNSTKTFYNIEKFYKHYENYKVGERVCLGPEFKNRKTKLVDNVFEINF